MAPDPGQSTGNCWPAGGDPRPLNTLRPAPHVTVGTEESVNSPYPDVDRPGSSRPRAWNGPVIQVSTASTWFLGALATWRLLLRAASSPSGVYQGFEESSECWMTPFSTMYLLCLTAPALKVGFSVTGWMPAAFR